MIEGNQWWEHTNHSFEGTYPLWQTVMVMATSAQLKRKDHLYGAAMFQIRTWLSSQSFHIQTIPVAHGEFSPFPVATAGNWFCKIGSQLFGPASGPPTIVEQYKGGLLWRIGGSASVIVKLAMFGYYAFSDTSQYHAIVGYFATRIPIIFPLPSGNWT